MRRTKVLGFMLSSLVSITAPAHADFHIGPQLGFQLYHRNAPEEASSVRLSGGLSVKSSIVDHWPTLEVAGTYESGRDSFATQNFVNDRIFRIRAGGIWNPFRFEEPLFGVRFGLQYSIAEGVYDKVSPALSTDQLQPRYFSPYLGLMVAMFPVAGFGVEDELTLWWDAYFKGFVVQMSFGIDVM